MNIKKINKFLSCIKTIESYRIYKVNVNGKFLYKIINVATEKKLNKVELYISENYGGFGYRLYFFNEWLSSPDLGHIYNRYYIKNFDSFETTQTFEEALFLCIYKVEKKISLNILKDNEDIKDNIRSFLNDYFLLEESSDTLLLSPKNLNLSYNIKKIENKNSFIIDNFRFNVYENNYYLIQTKSFIEALYFIYDKMSLKYFLECIHKIKKI